MMAKNHLIVAAGSTAAISLAIHNLAYIPPLVVGVMVGSLFPDMDTYDTGHPNNHPGSWGNDPSTSSSARITHAVKPVTTWVSHGITAVSGGHRKGTHSPIGIFVEGSLLFILARTSHMGALIICAALCVLFMRSVIRYRNSHGVLRGPLVIVLGIILGYYLTPLYVVMIASFVLGNVVHVLSDLPCGHIPWGWPISPYQSNIRWFTVKSPAEDRIGHLALLVTLILVALSVVAHLPELRALVSAHDSVNTFSRLHLPDLNKLRLPHL
jgi:hypothetical protein